MKRLKKDESMFFEKTNKLDKSLARLVTKIREYIIGSGIKKCI